MVSQWSYRGVAINLRWSPEVEVAVRSAPRRLGRSQQEVIREATACHLGLVTKEGGRSELDELVPAGGCAATSDSDSYRRRCAHAGDAQIVTTVIGWSPAMTRASCGSLVITVMCPAPLDRMTAPR